MSINTLLVDNADKSWSNLFVNSMTIYKDLEVRGDFSQSGNIDHDGDVQHTGDVLIDGELVMSNINNNNANGYSINVVGDFKIHSDGQLEGKRLLIDPNNPFSVPMEKLDELTGILTMGGPIDDIPVPFYALKFGRGGEFFVLLEIKGLYDQTYNGNSTWIRSQNRLPAEFSPQFGQGVGSTLIVGHGVNNALGEFFIESDLAGEAQIEIYSGINREPFSSGDITFREIYITYKVN